MTKHNGEVPLEKQLEELKQMQAELQRRIDTVLLEFTARTEQSKRHIERAREVRR